MTDPRKELILMLGKCRSINEMAEAVLARYQRREDSTEAVSIPRQQLILPAPEIGRRRDSSGMCHV